MSRPFSIVAGDAKKHGGLKLHVLLTPKAALDKVGAAELYGDKYVLRARVRALPDKGLANKALIKLLAKWAGVPKSSIELLSGGQSRHKVLLLSGDGDDLFTKLDGLLQD